MLFVQHIRDETEGFFGLRALTRTHYFIVLISCASTLRQLQSDLQHFFPSKFFCCQSLANQRIRRTTTWRSIATQRKRCTRRVRSESPPDDLPPQWQTLSSTPARSSQTTNPAKRPTTETSHNGPSLQIYYKYDNVMAGNRRSWV